MLTLSQLFLSLVILASTHTSEPLYAIVDRVEEETAIVEINQQLIAVDSEVLPGRPVEGTVYEFVRSPSLQNARLSAAEQRLQRLQDASSNTISL